MLYPTLKDLTEKVGNRYLLVNEVAHKARKIADSAVKNGDKVPEKPVKLAILQMAKELDISVEPPEEEKK